MSLVEAAPAVGALRIPGSEGEQDVEVEQQLKRGFCAAVVCGALEKLVHFLR